MFTVHRSSHNPLLLPARERSWEAYAAFNWSPIIKDDVLHCLYRAQSHFEPIRSGTEYFSMSVIGKTESEDGIHFGNRRPFIEPIEAWEQYGCEDPRVTFFEGKYYTFYTALSEFPFNKNGIKVAVAVSDDLETVSERHLVTPFNAKAMALFPERVNGKITVIVTVNPDDPPARAAFFQCDEIEELWDHALWKEWYENLDEHLLPDLRRDESEHTEIGAVPIKVDEGWLLVYSHIAGYFSDRKRFGVEAVLLEGNDVQTIIGRTPHSILVPEEHYEQYGHVPDIVFPSGAVVYGKRLDIYYGAADTASGRASVNLDNLLRTLVPERCDAVVRRFPNNPILEPLSEHKWESRLVFNPAAIDIDGTVHILYRAMGGDNTSVIGLAESVDGRNIDTRHSEPIYVPREPFEQKMHEGNSGCEDPRIMHIDKDLHMLYTAYDGVNVPRVAATHIPLSDFKARNWDAWSTPVLISQPNIMDKDACIIPQKYDNGYLVLHRLETNICGDFVEGLDFEGRKIDKCIQILQARPGMWDAVKVGIAGPPLKTKEGWLLFYHGVGYDKEYRLGAALLDLYNPTNVVARTALPIMSPVESYEREGEMPNVVFPCGQVERGGTIYLYYGGADTVVAGATLELETVLKMFR